MATTTCGRDLRHLRRRRCHGVVRGVLCVAYEVLAETLEGPVMPVPEHKPENTMAPSPPVANKAQCSICGSVGHPSEMHAGPGIVEGKWYCDQCFNLKPGDTIKVDDPVRAARECEQLDRSRAVVDTLVQLTELNDVAEILGLCGVKYRIHRGEFVIAPDAMRRLISHPNKLFAAGRAVLARRAEEKAEVEAESAG